MVRLRGGLMKDVMVRGWHRNTFAGKTVHGRDVMQGGTVLRIIIEKSTPKGLFWTYDVYRREGLWQFSKRLAFGTADSLAEAKREAMAWVRQYYGWG